MINRPSGAKVEKMRPTQRAAINHWSARRLVASPPIEIGGIGFFWWVRNCTDKSSRRLRDQRRAPDPGFVYISNEELDLICGSIGRMGKAAGTVIVWLGIWSLFSARKRVISRRALLLPTNHSTTRSTNPSSRHTQALYRSRRIPWASGDLASGIWHLCEQTIEFPSLQSTMSVGHKSDQSQIGVPLG
jgi:hypothetical protein